MSLPSRVLPAALLLPLACLPARAEKPLQARLWQERVVWDALLHSRDRAARQSADPRLLEVVLAVAHQVAQQAVNIQQIQGYARGQADNLRFAFSQKDPSPSLAVVQGNFATLSKGTDQIRNNLYYLTVRVRMACSQALPDARLTENATVLIAQIQNVQLKLNDLYHEGAAVQRAVQEESWAADRFLSYGADRLLGAVVSVQDSVFSVYNASYELYMLSK